MLEVVHDSFLPVYRLGSTACIGVVRGDGRRLCRSMGAHKKGYCDLHRPTSRLKYSYP